MEREIYIVSYNNVVTGGTESLHQLAYEIQSRGHKVYIYYIDNPGAKPPNKFAKYGIVSIDEIKDEKKNWVIVPETKTEFLCQYRYINKCIWWLSLDYYLNRIPKYKIRSVCKNKGISLFFAPIVGLLLFMCKKMSYKYMKIEDMKRDVLHLYNCEYVHEFLKENGIDENNMYYLCGPISEEYFGERVDFSKKQNIILYNPSKGERYTKKVIKRINKKVNVQIIPIKNMNISQIIEVMKKAKVYMDFGYFPGPERIPREAVTLGCNVITSTNGSAANDVDVLISRKYKFEDRNCNINNIVNMICDMINSYNVYYPEFEAYREKVIEQRNRFAKDIELILKTMIEL